MKRTLIVLALMAASVALGAWGMWWHSVKTFRGMAQASQDMYAASLFAHELNEADEATRNPDRAVAIHVLAHAVRTIDAAPASSFMSCREVAFRLAKLELHLAKLHRDAGNAAQETLVLESVLRRFAAMGWSVDGVAGLREALPTIETEGLASAFTRFGRVDRSRRCFTPELPDAGSDGMASTPSAAGRPQWPGSDRRTAGQTPR